MQPFRSALPSGHEHSISGSMLPDLQVSFRVFAAHRRKVNAHWSFPEHKHSQYEINVVLEGSQHMRVEGKDYQQTEGELLWLTPNQRHSSLGALDGATMEYVCIHFEVDDPWLRQRLNQLTLVRYPVGSTLEQALRPVIQDVGLAAKESEGTQLKLLTLQASFRLFGVLIELLLQEEQHISSLTATTELAKQIAAYIERECAQSDEDNKEVQEPLRIERLAEQLGYSSTYCNRVFHKAYGISPRQYVSMIKLRKAKLLLMDPTLTIEQISEQLGYRDLSQFSKQFKRWTNMSPTAYRQLSY
ncbi:MULTISPECIES: AraC family transcriptional regulator [unclassified Paenibacillus]|uniref:helix-turn-helix transcriptional regulator n=1 Tax=unclassified Paenibacillus TaxID=185978 RepID=UPI0027804F21|nr:MULTISPECIES: AraC family transcriptional regulator [unclassified Paenibacillus]MDQ0896691.1 AraC-like DNA-binding protein [Paenibacillus sp. V4I7]MDQ0917201.1 AraC-like DNA-binding protein [Paenibacillus sp. V4I5]